MILMKISMISACSDLGVHVNGTDKGPETLIKNNENIIKKENVEKERSKKNKEKNFKYLNKFNEELYNMIISINDFVITVGGDHSIAISTCLASKKKHGNIGLIWIDAHADFHTFESTISGNIHGMPFATVVGENGNRLSYFFNGEYFDPKNTVLVGGRDIESPEYENLKKAGTKIFTTEDIKGQGVEKIMKEAIRIATENTEGMHISYDLDVIDPKLAPGVSIKAEDGITIEEAKKILNEIIKKKKN